MWRRGGRRVISVQAQPAWWALRSSGPRPAFLRQAIATAKLSPMNPRAPCNVRRKRFHWSPFPWQCRHNILVDSLDSQTPSQGITHLPLLVTVALESLSIPPRLVDSLMRRAAGTISTRLAFRTGRVRSGSVPTREHQQVLHTIQL